MREPAARNSVLAAGEMARRGWASNWGAFADGELVGSLMLFLDGDAPGIYDVATIPRLRRSGVATALLLAIGQIARARGLRRVVLQNALNLERLYEKVGFRRVSFLDHWQYSSEALQSPLARAPEC